MPSPSIPQLVILLVLFLLVVLPIILVAKSDLARGGEKALWVVVAILFSWLGYIGFRIAMGKNNQDQLNQNE